MIQVMAHTQPACGAEHTTGSKLRTKRIRATRSCNATTVVHMRRHPYCHFPLVCSPRYGSIGLDVNMLQAVPVDETGCRTRFVFRSANGMRDKYGTNRATMRSQPRIISIPLCIHSYLTIDRVFTPQSWFVTV